MTTRVARLSVAPIKGLWLASMRDLPTSGVVEASGKSG